MPQSSVEPLDKDPLNSNRISVVGPDSIQVLQSSSQSVSFAPNQNVTLILCGESHEEALDVTRSNGGILEAREGWIPQPPPLSTVEFDLRRDTNRDHESGSSLWSLWGATTNTHTKDDNIAKRGNQKLRLAIHATNNKALPLGKAKPWAQSVLDRQREEWDGMGVVLLWILDKTNNNQQQQKVSKGQSFLLGWDLEEEDDDDDDDDDDESDQEEEEEDDEWIDPWKEPDRLPLAVREWIDSWNPSKESTKYGFCCWEWGDLDLEAGFVNRRRLYDENELSIQELDEIIEQRKVKMKELRGGNTECLWTFDEWLLYVRNRAKKQNIDVQVVLEASVPPWELSLHRPAYSKDDKNDNSDPCHLPPAANCVRGMSEDEEDGDEQEYDPSNDGVGSYLDHLYRKLMEQMMQEETLETKDPKRVNNPQSTWLHCVDVRDLGCQSACHSDSVKGYWNDLLTPREQEILLLQKQDRPPFQGLVPDSNGSHVQFEPECRMNPERLELQCLRAQKLIKCEEDDDDDEEEEEGEESEFTFPSFEGFFGQNTDFLYYSPHIKLCYSPFLAKCVQSLDTWEEFFSQLFLGGTIPEALALLDLDLPKRGYLYVRSPIQTVWNNDSNSYQYQYRDDGEHYITYPFFPLLFYLCAKGSTLPRTYSSHLYNRLCQEGNTKFALAARDWTLAKIQQWSLDPKGNDDPHCGGEWFEAFLHAVHRDIYDDIDRTDCAVLLQKQKVKSLTLHGRKHNIGKIKIPSCQGGFDEIRQRFQQEELVPHSESLVTPRVEVLAKILIDIWMSGLVDFTAVLQIANIITSPTQTLKESTTQDPVVVVVYMGAAHTRAICDFFVNVMGFKKKSFHGKTNYEEGETRALKLPKSMWELEKLFK